MVGRSPNLKRYIMKRISLITLIVSAVLTVLFVLLWVAGFMFAGAAVGNLVHLLLVASFIAGFGVIIGAILLLISMFQKK